MLHDILKGIGLKILRRSMLVLYWMMLGYVIGDLDDVNIALGGCDTFLHSLLFPGNRSQLGRMLTYCTSLPPTPRTLAVMMMVSIITNAIILLSLIDVSKTIDVDDPSNTVLLKILT